MATLHSHRRSGVSGITRKEPDRCQCLCSPASTQPSRLRAGVDPSSAAATHAILRATGIVMLIGIAVVHVVQLVPTFQQTPLLGGAFVMLIMAAVAVGAHLVRGAASSVRLWLPVAGLGLAVVGGYAFTRMFSTPLDNQDVGSAVVGHGKRPWRSRASANARTSSTQKRACLARAGVATPSTWNSLIACWRIPGSLRRESRRARRRLPGSSQREHATPSGQGRCC
jgi:hypothetical protein